MKLNVSKIMDVILALLSLFSRRGRKGGNDVGGQGHA